MPTKKKKKNLPDLFHNFSERRNNIKIYPELKIYEKRI
jgi:hypothetical protein